MALTLTGTASVSARGNFSSNTTGDKIVELEWAKPSQLRLFPSGLVKCHLVEYAHRLSLPNSLEKSVAFRG